MRSSRSRRPSDLPREYVVLDTETTGSPPGCRLVEVGALKVHGRSVVERFKTLVYPEAPIPAEATEIHGIRDRDVAAAPHAGEALPRLLAWLGGLPLLAHNARFDAGVLAAEGARFQIPLGENPVYCTLHAARKHLSLPSKSLVALVRDLGLPPGRHHRAVQDAEHALHLFWKLQDTVPDFSRRSLGRGRPLCSFRPEAPLLPASRRVLAEAADLHEAVDLHYSLKGQRVIPLRVTPRFFFVRGRAVLMEALCHQDLFYKSYRLDRIAAARLCPDAPPVEVRRKP